MFSDLKNFQEYKINNREKLNEVIVCECGGKYKRQNKKDHVKTLKHNKYLETLT